MSTEHIKIVLDRVRHPDDTCQFVLIALAEYANKDGQCYPSMARLAERCRRSQERIRKVIARLEAEGFFKRESRHREDGSQSSNAYVLTLDVGVVGTTPLGTVTTTPLVVTTPPGRDHPPGHHARPAPLVTKHDHPALVAQVTTLNMNHHIEPPLEQESKSAPRARTPRGARLENDWSPSDDLCQWTRTSFPQSTAESLQREVENFRDYWTSRPGAAACKLDWDATWRVWCRRAFATAPMRPRAGTSMRPSESFRPTISDIARSVSRYTDAEII